MGNKIAKKMEDLNHNMTFAKMASLSLQVFKRVLEKNGKSRNNYKPLEWKRNKRRILENIKKLLNISYSWEVMRVHIVDVKIREFQRSQVNWSTRQYCSRKDRSEEQSCPSHNGRCRNIDHFMDPLMSLLDVTPSWSLWTPLMDRLRFEYNFDKMRGLS